MNIRAKLTLLFFALVAIILTVASAAIYFFSSDYREDEFYRRLRSKAENTAKLLIEVEEVDANLLRRIEQNNPSNLAYERVIIYDYRNDELYNSDTGDSIQVSVDFLNQIRLEEEVRVKHNEFEVLGFLYTDRYDRFTVVSAAIDIYGLRKMENLRNILLIVAAISFVLVPLTGWIYAGRALGPISNIVNQVDTISAARLDMRLAEGNGTDELAKLSQTFNKMLDRLESAFQAQRNFIANASHELRTPITAIAGEIEVALLQPRTNQKYGEILQTLLNDVKELNMLVNQLLLLAQASTEGAARKFESIRIDEVLWSAKEDLVKSNPSYQVGIEFDLGLSDEALEVVGDEQLLKAAFSNLMDNGCKYSGDQKVLVELKRADGTIRIDVRNQGIGISEDDRSIIFEPFHRGKNTQMVRGHGIGLSLVSRIIQLHEGVIGVQSEPQGTTTFTVSLPI